MEPEQPPQQTANLKSVSKAAEGTNKLLQLVTVQLVKLFKDESFPRELKLLLIPLLFMVPLYSLTVLILVSDVTYCMLSHSQIQFYYYLIFLGLTAPSIFAMLLVYALLSDRYVNALDLTSQLETVTAKRRSRMRTAGTPQ